MLLTLVIPVYNVESYLGDFLESISTVNANKVELLFINDGSTDDSFNILKKFQRAHLELHVHIVTSPNGGLSKARNIGIQKSLGEYLWFVDSDDLLDLRYLDVLLQYLEEQSPDLIQIGVTQFADGSTPSWEKTAPQLIRTSAEMLFHQLATSEIENYAVGHIAKASIYRQYDQYFPVGRAFEDVATKYKVLMASNTCVKSEFAFYWYRQRSNSIVHAATLKSVQDILQTVETILKTDMSFPLIDKTELLLRILRLAYARLFDVSAEENDVKDLSKICRQLYIRIARPEFFHISNKSRVSLLLMGMNSYGLFIQGRKVVGRIRYTKGSKHESY